MDMSIFSQAQLIEIRKGQLLELDITVYAHKKYKAWKMRQIRNTLWCERVEQYLWEGISTEQKREIEFGLIQGVEVSVYASPDYSVIEMQTLRRHLMKETSNERCEATRTIDQRPKDGNDAESDRTMHS